MLQFPRTSLLRFTLGLVALIPWATAGYADVAGFKENYSAQVNGITWGLQLERSKTLFGVIIGNLDPGNNKQRLVLMGSASDGVIDGTYKPFYQVGAGTQAFQLSLVDDGSARLQMAGVDGFPAKGVLFTANAGGAIDRALIGTWRTEPQLGISSEDPYAASQWVMDFRDNGVLCSHEFVIDSRRDSATPSPCSVSDQNQWRIEKNRIMANTGPNGEWQLLFHYRIMSEHLFLSLPNSSDRKVLSKDEQAVAHF